MKNKNYIFGLHAVTALLQHEAFRIHHLLIMKNREDSKISAIILKAKQENIALEFVAKTVLDDLSAGANHQGVLAYCTPPSTYHEEDLPIILKKRTSTPPLILILDRIQDPHNLGACFRTADAAGVDVIIAPKDHSVGITPVVSKVATGAVETVPFVQVTNLVRALQTLKDLGVWMYGAALDTTQSLFNTDLSGPTAIVLGAESSGLRRLTREHCDALIKIPMHGEVSSLNVSVAAGILLFEALRQRNSRV